MNQSKLNYLTWSLFTLSILFPLVVWGSYINWDLSSLTAYQWFPLFGILAWMIMWTHYISGAIMTKYSLKHTELYGGISSVIVLFSLLLHPGILAFAQYDLGEGLPPSSFYSYVSSGLKIAVLFGSIALLIFLSFEVFRHLREKQIIKKAWIYISLSQSFAMILVFVHALRLGDFFGSNWFLFLWYLCGILLIPCFYIIHKNEIDNRNTSDHK